VRRAASFGLSRPWLDWLERHARTVNDNLKLRENRERGVYIENVTETYVATFNEVLGTSLRRWCVKP
jgi:hypothetical protein